MLDIFSEPIPLYGQEHKAWLFADIMHSKIDECANDFYRFSYLIDEMSSYCCSVQLTRWSELADIGFEDDIANRLVLSATPIETEVDSSNVSWSLSNMIIDENENTDEFLAEVSYRALKEAERYMSSPFSLDENGNKIPNEYIRFASGTIKPAFKLETLIEMKESFCFDIYDLFRDYEYDFLLE